MKTEDLKFPIFDDREYPPPVLSMDEFMQRLVARVSAMSPVQRDAAMSRDDRNRIAVRFRLSEE